MDPTLQSAAQSPPAPGGPLRPGEAAVGGPVDPGREQPKERTGRRRPDPTGRPRRRWTLRARLIALVVATAAVALVAVDIVVPLVVRSESINSKDVTLAAANARAKQGLTINDQPPAMLHDDSGLKGEVGWSFVTLGGVRRVLLEPASDEDANPDTSSGAWLYEPTTVGSASHTDQRYRALGFSGVTYNQQPGYLVAWIPMSDLDEQLRRLVLAELLITVGLLVLLGATAGLVIRRELRPLESIASAADAIARGDLTRCFFDETATTEI